MFDSLFHPDENDNGQGDPPGTLGRRLLHEWDWHLYSKNGPPDLTAASAPEDCDRSCACVWSRTEACP